MRLDAVTFELRAVEGRLASATVPVRSLAAPLVAISDRPSIFAFGILPLTVADSPIVNEVAVIAPEIVAPVAVNEPSLVTLNGAELGVVSPA